MRVEILSTFRNETGIAASCHALISQTVIPGFYFSRKAILQQASRCCQSVSGQGIEVC